MAEKEKVTSETAEAEVSQKEAKADKVKKEVSKDTAKSAKKKPKKEKKGWFRGTWGEMKKVTWPSFGTTMKQTGIVIGVTAFFLVIVTGIDAFLGFLYQLLTKKIG